MTEPLDENCADESTRDADRPCLDLLTGLAEGPLRGDRPAGMRVSVRDRTRAAVYVGTGTCGLGAGAGKTLDVAKKYVSEHGLEADVVEVGCIGFCSMEPLVDVELPGRTRVSFGCVTADKAVEVLEAAFAGEMKGESALLQFRPEDDARAGWEGVPFIDEHPFFEHQKRLVLENCGVIDPQRIDEYIARGGYRAFAEALRGMAPEEICDVVTRSGLRGRGGGGFPTGKKWSFALETGEATKYLICNADEGDPGAFMDRAVIEGDPHRLLEGLAIAAYAIGATKAYIYIRAEYPLAIARLERALGDARSSGLIGHDILGSGFDLEIAIKKGAGAFVCGEETALIASIEGRRGMPKPRPPYPTEKGLFGKPTVINNVETLANVPVVLRDGAERFASIGTETSKGTKVFAVSGKVTRTGLVEVPMGTTIGEIVEGIGGGVENGRALKAVQIGGPSGGCIPAEHMGIQVDYDSLKSVGAMMGSGGLVVMDDRTCMVDLAKFFMAFIQRESCGKCIPCREGTRRMYEILERITRGRRGETAADALERFQGVIYLKRLAESIRDTSLCGLGQTAPNPVLSTLRWFRDEYEEHVYERKCRAGVCAELLTFTIDPEKCRGCTLCAKKCPAGAIVGAAKSPHHIIAEKCVGCGTCADVCRFDAVVVS